MRHQMSINHMYKTKQTHFFSLYKTLKWSQKCHMHLHAPCYIFNHADPSYYLVHVGFPNYSLNLKCLKVEQSFTRECSLIKKEKKKRGTMNELRLSCPFSCETMKIFFFFLLFNILLSFVLVFLGNSTNNDLICLICHKQAYHVDMLTNGQLVSMIMIFDDIL